MKKFFAILFSATAFFALTIQTATAASSTDATQKLYTRQGTTIKINKGVSTLPRWCLSDELGAERIILPTSVTKIERGALLKYCMISCATQAQKDFCIENGYAVEGTFTIKNGVLTIKDGVTVVSPAIARGNTSITKIILPNSVKEIEPYAFCDMTNLTEINLPESLETIGAAAFYDCNKLNITKIPESVKFIGSRAFANTAITDVTLGKNTQYDTLLSTSSFFGRVNVHQEASQAANTTNAANATKPAINVENAAALAPKYCMDITGWKKNDFTTEWQPYEWSFPANAFKAGSNTITFTYTSGGKKLCLKDVVITADSKTVLNDSAEKSAGSKPKNAEYTFTLNTIPKSLTLKAMGRTDGGTNSNGNITVNGATAAFSAQKDVISSGVLKIGEGQIATKEAGYMQNTSFTAIEFPSSIRKISPATFQVNTRLQKVTIPGNVKEVAEWSFARCRVLKEVVMEEGVEVLGEYAFYDCPKLESVTVPKSLRYIKDVSSLFWGDNNITVFRCYAGSEAHRLATEYGYKVEIIGIDEQNADTITELIYNENTVVQPVDVICKNLTYIGVGKAETISAGAFQKCPVPLIDLSDTIKSIGKNAFNSASKIRMPRGSYAEQWAKQNGYYLCEALADLSTYTKDKSIAINENDFTRILCNSDTIDDIAKYRFNVTHPLMLNVVENSLELTSYMLYPCKNVTIKKQDANGKETVIAQYNKIQPLARYVIAKNMSNVDTKATYTVTADDDFYKSLSELPVNWDLTFTQFRQMGGEGNWIVMRAPQCREWISLMTQMAYVMGSNEFEGYFLTSKKRFFTGAWSDDMNQTFLFDTEVRKTFRQVIDYSIQLGALDARSNATTVGLGSVGTFDGSLLGLDEPFIGRHYRAEDWVSVGTRQILRSDFYQHHNWFEIIAHEMMHNMGYEHDSNFCGNTTEVNGLLTVYEEELSFIARQLKLQGRLPYDDEHTLSTRLYWFYDYYYVNQKK